ncbi:MAG: tetratricopeptide repeat protein [Candidatus Obscuribacterales bacterium]|nr:tetratricopeptide repeat protein [Candidatus Obscuribacterales bacterium]
MANSQVGNHGGITSTVVRQTPGGNQLFAGSYVPVSTVAKDSVGGIAWVDGAEREYLDRLTEIRHRNGRCQEEIEVLVELARHYLACGSSELTMKTLEDARRSAEIVYGGQHAMVAELMVELGFVSFKMQEYETAREYLEPAVVIFEQSYGKVSDQVAFAFHKLGRVYEATNNLEQAQKYYQKAVTTYQNTFNEDESEMLMARNDLARLKSSNQ